jgi:hypothetical protein
MKKRSMRIATVQPASHSTYNRVTSRDFKRNVVILVPGVCLWEGHGCDGRTDDAATSDQRR